MSVVCIISQKYLPRALHTLEDADITDDPGKSQAAQQLPIEVRHIIKSTRCLQNVVPVVEIGSIVAPFATRIVQGHASNLSAGRERQSSENKCVSQSQHYREN